MLDYFPSSSAYAEFLQAAPTRDESQTISTNHLDELAELMVTLFADDSVRRAQINRTVIAAAAHSMNDQNLRLISSHLGFAGTSALRRATARARKRMLSEPSLTKVVEEFRLQLLDKTGMATAGQWAA